MNYQITCEMEEYDPETDQMLFYLPLVVQHLKKFITIRQWVDHAPFRSCRKIKLSHNTTTLYQPSRIAQQFTMGGNDLRKLQLSFYKDIDLKPGTLAK